MTFHVRLVSLPSQTSALVEALVFALIDNPNLSPSRMQAGPKLGGRPFSCSST